MMRKHKEFRNSFKRSSAYVLLRKILKTAKEMKLATMASSSVFSAAFIYYIDEDVHSALFSAISACVASKVLLEYSFKKIGIALNNLSKMERELRGTAFYSPTEIPLSKTRKGRNI